MESARATLVPVAQSDKGYTRLLRDVSPSAAETDTTVGRRFASRRSGVRFPVSPPRERPGQRHFPLNGRGPFHLAVGDFAPWWIRGDGSSTTTVAVIPLSGRPVVESLTSQHRFEVHARPVVPLTTGWICRSEQPGILAARRYERVWLGAVTSRRG